MFASERTCAGHAFRLTVVCVSGGWEIQEEWDEQVVRLVRYTDWHRVERMIQAFERRELDATATASRATV